MKQFRRGWKRLVGAIAGSRRESELAAEMEMHLQMQTEDNLKLGMSPQEARRAAILKFGGIESVKERYREQRGLPVLEAWGKDMRHAFRSMRRNPGFAAAAILSLALGMGATTAIFSVADSVLLQSLPYAQPERLTTVSVDGAISAPLYEAFRREARSIEHAALFTSWYFNLAGQGEPERIPAARVSAELFDVLGVAPALGRTFSADEDQRGRENVVVIGDGLWKRRFGGDPNVIGRTLTLNDAPNTVIGVMPPGFRFPEGPEHHATVGPFPPAEMWRPMALLDWERTCKGCFNWGMLVRLRPGVNERQAAAELTSILAHQVHPRNVADLPEVTVLNLQGAVTGKVRSPIMILLGAVVLALLIACVNVANLMLARGLRRREEIAIRLCLGATRRRLVQQGFTEALTFALCAAGLAVVLAWAAVRIFISIAPAGLPRIEDVAIDLRMFGFTLCLAVATAVLFGIAPAVLTARGTPGETMKIGGRTISAPSRLRSALVATELALSLVLLVGCGLLAKSFVTVLQIPLGFRAENVLTMRTTLPSKRYDDHLRATLIERLISNCSAHPGVISAAATSTLPLTGESEGWGLLAEDNPNREAYVMTRVRAVTPGYFRTLGIRLRAGREFNENDRGTTPVAIISESAARRLWPGVANPIGRRLLDKPPMTIVGIVEDTHASGIDAEIRPYLYLPFWQFSPPEFAVALRSASDPTPLVSAVKAEIWRIDKHQPVTDVAGLKQIVSDSIAPRRFEASLMTVFAVFALLLAAIGIYGVLSYSVAHRTREIGIRMALGATCRRVVADVVKQAGILAIAGAAIGLVAAFRLAPLLRSLLYGVDVAEKSIFIGAAGLLVAVALIASIMPARRAAKLDPAECLHYE
ncbi:MAG: ABC transporter permease [Acidobacteriia bacterium]|nr:ABC transporter permease [Terriglobia bacterium]